MGSFRINILQLGILVIIIKKEIYGTKKNYLWNFNVILVIFFYFNNIAVS